MANLTPNTDKKQYINIGQEGTFRWEVEEGTEGAVVREYELSDGTKGSKLELHANEITDGYIRSIEFIETKFGENMIIQIDDYMVSLNSSSNYATSLMKVLPNLDLTGPVDLHPYSFTDDKGKQRKGISVRQDGEKIKDAFYDFETKKSLNGMPEPKGDISAYNKDKWKAYFLEVKMFLVDYTTEKIVPKIPAMSDEELVKTKEEEIPFE